MLKNKLLIGFLVLLSLVFSNLADARLKAKKIQKLAEEVDNSAVDRTGYFEETFPRDLDIKENEKLTGSLWIDSYQSHLYKNLHRATNVGDMVTIVIDESATGSDVAETKLNRVSTDKLGVQGLFGIINKLTSSISGLQADQIVDTSHNSIHNGKGETKRRGQLNAMITARVMRVLKNGDMQIRAQKNIKLNNEEQAMILEGFIRPYDISADNTIQSSFIADSRITFNGFGVVADQQKPGWLTSILSKILPF